MKTITKFFVAAVALFGVATGVIGRGTERRYDISVYLIDGHDLTVFIRLIDNHGLLTAIACAEILLLYPGG